MTAANAKGEKQSRIEEQNTHCTYCTVQTLVQSEKASRLYQSPMSKGHRPFLPDGNVQTVEGMGNRIKSLLRTPNLGPLPPRVAPAGELANEPVPDRAKRLILLHRRRRQDNRIPDLLSVDKVAVLETALHASLMRLDRDGAELGVALVYVPVSVSIRFQRS